jgi:hypothetical protein
MKPSLVKSARCDSVSRPAEEEGMVSLGVEDWFSERHMLTQARSDVRQVEGGHTRFAKATLEEVLLAVREECSLFDFDTVLDAGDGISKPNSPQ